MSNSPYRAFWVSRQDDGTITRCMHTVTEELLPAGDVTIDVCWSSLNFKDALAATGHAGVVKQFPHIPGIDAAGTICSAPDLPPGTPVIVTGYELGAGRWGGWCEKIRVPRAWVVPLPDGLSLRQAMILGTAGFTAAQCVRALRRHGVTPDHGPIAVSGATGGVGCLSICLLANLGYPIVAATGKAEAHGWLKELGATEIVGRDALVDTSDRPLLAARWAGAIDTVGGQTLTSLLRATQVNGCVAACGVVGGDKLPLTVYPFILRGVALDGITSALCPLETRHSIWNDLAGPWRIPRLDALADEVTLEELDQPVDAILAGRVRGRVVVRVQDA